MEKLCIFCKHFSFENDIAGEYAEGASANCAMNHYKSYTNHVSSEYDLREIFLNAINCHDYTPPEIPNAD